MEHDPYALGILALLQKQIEESTIYNTPEQTAQFVAIAIAYSEAYGVGWPTVDDKWDYNRYLGEFEEGDENCSLFFHFLWAGIPTYKGAALINDGPYVFLVASGEEHELTIIVAEEVYGNAKAQAIITVQAPATRLLLEERTRGCESELKYW